MFALYLTIWAALVLFAVGETGRSLPHHRQSSWWWPAFSLGLALTIVHTLIAFDVVHHWVHDEAVRSTAMQTQAVFGVAVGWGVYVNYIFMAVWLLDAWAWRAQGGVERRPASITWTLRAFYMVMIFNGAVVFAAGARRVLGLLITCWLVAVWVLVRPATSVRPR